jgi:hypothetical protein
LTNQYSAAVLDGAACAGDVDPDGAADSDADVALARWELELAAVATDPTRALLEYRACMWRSVVCAHDSTSPLSFGSDSISVFDSTCVPSKVFSLWILQGVKHLMGKRCLQCKRAWVC